MLGWKTQKHYYETVELSNPRPTLPNKNQVKKWHLGHFVPQQIFFLWVGIGFIQETDHKKPNPTKLSANTLIKYRYMLHHNIVKWELRFSATAVAYLYRIPILSCATCLHGKPKSLSRGVAYCTYATLTAVKRSLRDPYVAVSQPLDDRQAIVFLSYRAWFTFTGNLEYCNRPLKLFHDRCVTVTWPLFRDNYVANTQPFDDRQVTVSLSYRARFTFTGYLEFLKWCSALYATLTAVT